MLNIILIAFLLSEYIFQSCQLYINYGNYYKIMQLAGKCVCMGF